MTRIIEGEKMKIQEWLLAKEKEEGVGSTLIKDIANHGCQGGVPGIIYYHETVAFYDEHQEEIFEQHVMPAHYVSSRTTSCGGPSRSGPSSSCRNGKQRDSAHFSGSNINTLLSLPRNGGSSPHHVCSLESL